jgi:hypothetical protein
LTPLADKSFAVCHALFEQTRHLALAEHTQGYDSELSIPEVVMSAIMLGPTLNKNKAIINRLI